MSNPTNSKKLCGVCDETATHFCATRDGWLFFCEPHALAHRKVCPECIEKRKAGAWWKKTSTV